MLDRDQYSLGEDQGPQRVLVLLSNGIQLARNVEVLVTTADGTAMGTFTIIFTYLIYHGTSCCSNLHSLSIVCVITHIT